MSRSARDPLAMEAAAWRVLLETPPPKKRQASRSGAFEVRRDGVYFVGHDPESRPRRTRRRPRKRVVKACLNFLLAYATRFFTLHCDYRASQLSETASNFSHCCEMPSTAN